MSGPRSGRVAESMGEARGPLEAVTRRTTVAAGLARRARIVLLVADGAPLDRIGRQIGVDRNVVRLWMDRYRAGDLAPDRPADAGRRPPDALALSRLAPPTHAA